MKWVRVKRSDMPWYSRFTLGVLPVMALAAAGAALLPEPMRIRCLFHRWAGFPCPGCGGTRAVRLMLKGDLLSAWTMQPLVCATSLFLGALVGFAFLAELLRFDFFHLKCETRSERIGTGILIGSLIVLNWIYLIQVQ
jgi:hypothetical protein